MQKVYKRTPASKTGHNVNPEDSLLVFENALPPGNRYDGYSYKEMFVVDPTLEFYISLRERLVELIKSKGFADDLTPGDITFALHDAKTKSERPPKAEEPKYLGAKVVDQGVLWEAVVTDAENTGGMVWFTSGGGPGKDWDAFSDEVKILFGGYPAKVELYEEKH